MYAFVRWFARLSYILCVCVARRGCAVYRRIDGRWRRNGRKTNERTKRNEWLNRGNAVGKEIVNERWGRRRNNIWPACKFPFGRKQAASRGGKARVGNTTKINACIVTAAGQYPQLHYVCYTVAHRLADVSTITDRAKRWESKEEWEEKEKKESAEGEREGNKSRIRRDASVAWNYLKLLEHFQYGISKVEQICCSL